MSLINHTACTTTSFSWTCHQCFLSFSQASSKEVRNRRNVPTWQINFIWSIKKRGEQRSRSVVRYKNNLCDWLSSLLKYHLSNKRHLGYVVVASSKVNGQTRFCTGKKDASHRIICCLWDVPRASIICFPNIIRDIIIILWIFDARSCWRQYA